MGPDFRAGALRDFSRQAHMVGVMVRDNDALNVFQTVAKIGQASAFHEPIKLNNANVMIAACDKGTMTCNR